MTTSDITDVAAAEEQLLRAVAEIAPVLQEGAQQAEEDGHLGDPAVEALRASGLWRMRLCTELGGHELPVTAQVRVLARLAAVDTASAWTTMVLNNGLAELGATMPDEAVTRVFDGGIPTVTVVVPPGGSATPVDGGYRLTGTWRFASAIAHADWVLAYALVERDPSRVLPVALPVADLDVQDSWEPVGLAATSSQDFVLEDYFVPDGLTGRVGKEDVQTRGRIRYDRVEVEFIQSYEHLAFACGVARRSLDELRGYLQTPSAQLTSYDREVVQAELGRAEVQLKAIWALTEDVYERFDRAAVGESDAWTDADRFLPRALAARATEIAMDSTRLAFHRSGFSAMSRGSVLDKLLRDMSVAAAHIAVDDSALAYYAQDLVEGSHV